jgi:hypothetical protein
MSYPRANFLSSPRNVSRNRLHLPVAVLAVTLMALALSVPAAQAAGAGDAASMTAFSKSSGKMPADPSLATVPFQPVMDAAAQAPAVGQTLAISQPRDATTGLFIGGPVSATVQNGQAVLRAGALINENTSAVTGLSLDLVATTTVPSGSFNATVLASISIGTIAAQSEIGNFDSGNIPFTPASTGCYYLSLVLLKGTGVEDVRTLPAGGTPENTGYSEFGFGQTCPAATTCTRNTNTLCLDSARFQVTVAYDNTATGAGAGQVLLFGATRAESDESGFYYFTDPSNFEMGVKVLNACGVNNFWWVFIGGLTNQGWSLNVLDTHTGDAYFYGNTNGVLTATTADTNAIPCP